MVRSLTDCLASLELDRRFVTWAFVWGAGSLLLFGLTSAIVPNPVFGRQIPPEPFAIVVWLLSAPLMGLIGATYSAPRAGSTSPAGPGTIALPLQPATTANDRRAGRMGTVAGFGAFLAIGCPVCNKIALVLLGTSGALTIWAPLQPIIGAASLLLLAATLAWRIRSRRAGGVCPV
jgi:hypothetical protein